MMRLLAPFAVASVLLFTTAARADGGASPSTAPAYAYSYEVENAEPEGRVLLVWPRICSASGDALGNVDLALNPDWTARANDVDYEVVVSGKHHELADSCRKTSRLYALGSAAFPRGTRATTPDDSALGQHVNGQPFPIVPLLDAIDRKRRIDFFDKDPRVLRTTFQLDAPKATKPLKALHEVLTVGPFTEGTFVVAQKSVNYTYQDGTSETVTPSVAPTKGDGGSAGDGGSSSAANPPANSANPPPASTPDIGTRWVFLAAVGGLVAGGLIAFYRKKKTS